MKILQSQNIAKKSTFLDFEVARNILGGGKET
jgi:hypothetical protein